jgi:hypothetical protein
MSNEINSVFDGDEAEVLKQQGMALGAANNIERLELARLVAVKIAKDGDGTCHADAVGKVMLGEYGIESLGPAAGSMFKGNDWVFTGIYKPSERVKSHGQVLRVWKYVGA